MKNTLKEIAGMLTILAVVITWPWLIAVWVAGLFLAPVVVITHQVYTEEKAKVSQPAADTTATN